MDFSESPRAREIRALVRDFLAREVDPLESRFLHEGFLAVRPELDERRERARATGLFAAHVAREFGGGGLDLVDFAALAEELGRNPLGHYVFNLQAPDAGNMELLAAHGTAAQRERYLRPLVEGALRSCFSMTEPEFAGSNPVWMGTTARRDGDAWVIDGRKWFTSSADGAAFAVCLALTDPENADPHRRASLLIVPTDAPGFERIENLSVMGQRGGGWASHAEVVYRSVRVPAEALIGAPGDGFALAQERLGPGRIHHCARWIGICERAFELLCRRAASRELAPGRPLGRRQIVQEWIAESRAEIHAARLMTQHAAWTIDRAGAKAAREEVSLLKFTVARTLQRVLDRSLQAHGALGMTDATPLAFWYAHERAARIYDGADEVHVESVALRILRDHGLARS